MGNRPSELGERRHEDRRTGVDGFAGWTGISLQGGPSTIPDDKVWDAQNVRLQGRIYFTRGGQAKINTLNIEEIQGFYDATDIGAANTDDDGAGTPYNAVYVAGNSVETGNGELIHIDTESNITTTTITTGRPAAANIMFYNDAYYGGANISPDAKVITLPIETELFTLPKTGSLAVMSGGVVAGGDIYVGWMDAQVGSQDHVISRWDGTLHEEFRVNNTNNGGLFLGVLGSTPIAGYTRTYLGGGLFAPTSIYVRNGGGTWDTVAIPTVSAQHIICDFAEYAGRLYFLVVDKNGGGGGDLDRVYILSTDGSSVTLDRTIVVTPVVATCTGALGVVGSTLYYWYHDGSSGAGFSKVGSYNGTAWNDGVVDLFVQIGAGYSKGLGFVAGPHGADAVYIDASNNVDVWESDGTNLAGTWTKVLTTLPADVTPLGTLVPPRALVRVAS